MVESASVVENEDIFDDKREREREGEVAKEGKSKVSSRKLLLY